MSELDWPESPLKRPWKGQTRVLSTRSDEYNLFLRVAIKSFQSHKTIWALE